MLLLLSILFSFIQRWGKLRIAVNNNQGKIPDTRIIVKFSSHVVSINCSMLILHVKRLLRNFL